jgi:opacity protein-like surface antigen
MKKTVVGTILVLFLSLAAPAAHAGILYLGIQGGLSQQKASFSDIKFDSDTSFLYGAKAGLRFAWFGAELNYFQAAHNINKASLSGWQDRKVDYNYLGVNLKWFFPILVVSPYLTVGYGYYTADIHDIDKDKNGGFNAGAGVEVMLGKSFALTAEGKYHHVKLDIGDETMSLGNFTMTGGLSFYF